MGCWVVYFTSFSRVSICDCVILLIDSFTPWLCGHVLLDISLDPLVFPVIFEMRGYVQFLIIWKNEPSCYVHIFLSVTKRPSFNMLSRFQGCLFLGASLESPRFCWKQRSNFPNSGTHKTFWICFIFPQSRQITTRRDMDDRDFFCIPVQILAGSLSLGKCFRPHDLRVFWFLCFVVCGQLIITPTPFLDGGWNWTHR